MVATVARSAMMEAIAHLQQALNLLAGTPDNLTRRRQELELQTMVGVPLMATRGMAAPEVERAYARARELCLEVGDEPQLFPVMFGLWCQLAEKVENGELSGALVSQFRLIANDFGLTPSGKGREIAMLATTGAGSAPHKFFGD